jgi:hypothetical protein
MINGRKKRMDACPMVLFAPLQLSFVARLKNGISSP